jgi:hypothetical protein
MSCASSWRKSVSSELERLLRDAREALPGPHDAATVRARGRAIAPPRTSRARGRILVLVGATLVAAIVLGVTAGSLTAPTGAAAREPAALGFVPEPGWFALQSPPPVVPGQQTVAVAANVPFARDDTIHGLSTVGSPVPTPSAFAEGHRRRRVDDVGRTAAPAPVLANPMYPEAKLPPISRWRLLPVGSSGAPDQPLAQLSCARESATTTSTSSRISACRIQPRQLDAAQRQLDGSDQAASRPQAAPMSSEAALRSPSSTTHTLRHDAARYRNVKNGPRDS